MPKISRTPRFLVAVVSIVGLAVGVAAVTEPSTAPAKAGASRVRTKTVARRRSAPIALDGLNETWAADTAVWYAGATQAEAARAAAAREETARRARDSAAHATTSRSTGTTTPRPVNSGSGCAYFAEIHAAFGGAGDWAVSIAMRESHCTTYSQGAYNPTPCGGGNHAVGLFQLCMPMHADLYPCDWRTANAACEIQAALNLYRGAGTSPWRL